MENKLLGPVVFPQIPKASQEVAEVEEPVQAKDPSRLFGKTLVPVALIEQVLHRPYLNLKANLRLSSTNPAAGQIPEHIHNRFKSIAKYHLSA